MTTVMDIDFRKIQRVSCIVKEFFSFQEGPWSKELGEFVLKA